MRSPSLEARALLAAAAIASGSCRERATSAELVVGAYFSFSGADSTFGEESREGIDLAVEEANAAGGIKGQRVKVLYEDDKSTTQEASQKVRQLVDRDKVLAILGEIASSRSLAGGLVANTSKVPMVSPSATALEVTQGREWVFRTCFTDDQQGQIVARFVKEELGRTKVGIFFAAQDTYSSGLARAFRTEAQRIGLEIVIEKGYQKGETNYRTYLSQLKAAGAEMVFVPNYYGEMVLIARQARELGIEGSRFIGGDGWDSQNLLSGAGEELEGAFFTNHYAPDVPWENSKRFYEVFRARYGHEPSSLAAQGYDSARVVFDAMARAPEPTRAEIRNALTQTKDFKGATGTITIGADRNAKKPVVVVRIHDKQFTFHREMPAQ